MAAHVRTRMWGTNMLEWFNRRRRQEKLNGALSQHAKFFDDVDYRHEYAWFLDRMDPDLVDLALPELFMFRVWLTTFVYQVRFGSALGADAVEGMVEAVRLVSRPSFEHRYDLDFGPIYGDPDAALAERFEQFGKAVAEGQTAADPFALRYVCFALALNAGSDFTDHEQDFLATRVVDQIQAIDTLIIGRPAAKLEIPPFDERRHRMLRPVHAFGGSQVFMDVLTLISESTGKRTGLFVYRLDAPGIDKRNQRPIREMRSMEEYDLDAGMFRVHYMEFTYTDGTPSDRLHAVPEWKPATAGNALHLEALRELQRQAEQLH